MPFRTEHECRMYEEALKLRDELDKWRDQIDALALFMWQYLPKPKKFPETPMELPRRYTFAYWPSREFRFRKLGADGKTVLFVLEQIEKPDYAVAGFAADIADGWFKEVAALLIDQRILFERAADRLPPGVLV